MVFRDNTAGPERLLPVWIVLGPVVSAVEPPPLPF